MLNRSSFKLRNNNNLAYVDVQQWQRAASGGRKANELTQRACAELFQSIGVTSP